MNIYLLIYQGLPQDLNGLHDFLEGEDKIGTHFKSDPGGTWQNLVDSDRPCYCQTVVDTGRTQQNLIEHDRFS